jgi:glycosyltransferase involved in cell wall biosynthesis
MIQADRNVVLQVGSIIPEKGVGDLIEAARLVLEKNTNVQFVFVGDGHAISQFREQARALGDHVTWTGLVGNPQAESVYEAADIVCQVSNLHKSKKLEGHKNVSTAKHLAL